VGTDFDIDAELPLRLPPQVISKVLELFTFVTNKEKKRRLRDALLVSAAQLELSSAQSSADRDREKVQERSKVKAEIRAALHPDEVGLRTRRLVRGKSDRGKATSVDTSFGPEMPLPFPDGVDDVEVGRGNNDSVFRTPSNPDGLDSSELSSLVHKMTGEAQVLAQPEASAPPGACAPNVCVRTHTCTLALACNARADAEGFVFTGMPVQERAHVCAHACMVSTCECASSTQLKRIANWAAERKDSERQDCTPHPAGEGQGPGYVDRWRRRAKISPRGW
jgi:hypothetical protein